LNCQTWWNRTPSLALEFNRYPKQCARADDRAAWIELGAVPTLPRVPVVDRALTLAGYGSMLSQ
jgi:hypothetical protein